MHRPITKKKIKKALLIRPPTTLPKKDLFSGVGEPLGLLYIAATLERKGYLVQILDAQLHFNKTIKKDHITYGMKNSQITEEIKKASPDIIGISWFTASNEHDVHNICKLAKRINPDTPIVLGGSYPTLFPLEVIRNPFIDYVIMGEGEPRFPKLIEHINNDQHINANGIISKDPASHPNANQPLEFIKNLDELPFPSRHLVDMKKYKDVNSKHKFADSPEGLLIATRGCFNKCYYCCEYKKSGTKIRHRSVKNIIKEIRFLKNQYGYQNFWFLDNNISAGKKFLQELTAAIKKENIRWSIPSGIYPDVIDKKMVKLFAESGLESLGISVESGSERTRKEIMRRTMNLDNVFIIRDEARKYNLPVTGNFVIGILGEKKADILATLDFIEKIDFDSAYFYIALPVAGTDFYNDCLKRGYLPKNYSNIDEAMSFKYILNIPKNSDDFLMEPKHLEKIILNFSKTLKMKENKKKRK